MTDRLVGFIGVGRMGGPMASRLLDAGYKLCVYDVSPEATQPFVARGAQLAASPAEVASTVSRINQAMSDAVAGTEPLTVTLADAEAESEPETVAATDGDEDSVAEEPPPKEANTRSHRPLSWVGGLPRQARG